MAIKLKRAYETSAAGDGTRILVDHLWPRGVKKECLHVERWMRDIAPTPALRKWFGHEPEKWPEFRRKYRDELKSKSKELDELAEVARKGTLTLVFAAKDAEHCNATVLRECIEKRLAH